MFDGLAMKVLQQQFKEKRKVDAETHAHLHKQLIKLGDMIGDGLHLEPGGRWITKEYRKVAKALGLIQSRANNSKSINKAMAKVLAEIKCPDCNGNLKQSRSGSKRAICLACNKKYQFTERKPRPGTNPDGASRAMSPH